MYYNLQIEEVEALSAIYADDWVVDPEADRKYIIKISNDVRLVVSKAIGSSPSIINIAFLNTNSLNLNT